MTFIAKYKDKILDIVQLVLFFVLGFKFFGLDMYISLVIFAFVVIRLLIQNKFATYKQIAKNEMIDIAVLAIFCVSSVLFKSIFDGKSMIFKNAFHFMFVIILFWLSSRTYSSKIGYKGITHIITYLAGTFFYISLCAGVTFAEFGLKSNVRWFIDVWSHQYMSCTIASLYLIPVTVFCFVGIPYLIKKKYYVIAPVLIIPIVISCYISIRLENRGFFTAAAIAAFLLCYIVFFQINSMREKDKPFKHFFLVCVPPAILFVTSAIFLLVRFNVGGIADFMRTIPFLERIISGGTDKVRSSIYRNFFINGWKYPFGGLKQTGSLGTGDYVHNALLDIYAVAGIIPFICLIYFYVRFVITVCVKKKYKDDTSFFLAISSVIIALFGISLFEPIFDANAYYFASFFGVFSIIARDNPAVIKLKKRGENKTPDQIEEHEKANENTSTN